jgi:putative protein kinase ArgK-like GTPase of G3E family
VLQAVAARDEGIDAITESLDRHWDAIVEDGTLARRRKDRLAERTRAVVDRAVHRWLWNDGPAGFLVNARLDAAGDRRVNPYEVAAEVVAAIKEGARV